VNNQLQNLRSFLTRFLPSQAEKIPEKNLADFQDFGVWKNVCEQILAKPFPPESSDFPNESLERDSRLTF
jgi:hypothetical protein